MRLDSARLGAARRGSAQRGAARLDSTRADPAPPACDGRRPTAGTRGADVSSARPQPASQPAGRPHAALAAPLAARVRPSIQATCKLRYFCAAPPDISRPTAPPPPSVLDPPSMPCRLPPPLPLPLARVRARPASRTCAAAAPRPPRPPTLCLRAAHTSAAATHPRARPPLLAVALLSAAASGALVYRLCAPDLDIQQPHPDAFHTDLEPHPPSPSHPPPNDLPGALSDIRASLNEDQITLNGTTTEVRGASPWSHHPTHPHGAVVLPESEDDVVVIVKACAAHNVPIVPYGGGSSLEAQTSAPSPIHDGRNSICIDFSRMKAILRFSPADGDVTVQPGIGWQELNDELARRGAGLFFPVDPGPTATIGGMVATGCSGTNAVRYGTMRGEHAVANVTVVLPSGEKITTRSRARKSSVGPNMTNLFVGSEATLGVITAITLRLDPILPQAVAIAPFNSIEQAIKAASALVRKGILPQCVELADASMVGAMNRAAAKDPTPKRLPGGETPMLFIKLQGATADHIAADWKVTKELLEQYGANHITYGDDQQNIDQLWKARKEGLWSVLANPLPVVPEAPDAQAKYGPWRAWVTDVCVPTGELAALLQRTRADIDEQKLYGPLLGHVADGNVHAILIYRERDEETLARVRAVVHRMNRSAQALGGTASGEHGVGIGKKMYLDAELGAGTVDLYRTIMKHIDPYDIMNPGKLVDADPAKQNVELH